VRTGAGMSLTTEAPTPARASEEVDASLGGPGRRWAVGAAGLLLLTTATVLALMAGPPTRDDARLPPVVAALFDFVWHLPAVLLTVTLLVGVVLPAPPGPGTRSPFRTAPGKESDEDKIAS
jgi:hypothetical protein